MSVTPFLIEIFTIIIAHAVVGIHSSDLKYSKKTTYYIWGIWAILQGLLVFCTEFLLKEQSFKFLLGFVSSLVGQYVIFFATTKGRFSQRLFTLLTYSVFFCIFVALSILVQGSLIEINFILWSVIHVLLIFGVVYYFLNYICSICKEAAKSITNEWYLLIFVNVIFMITIVASSVFPVRLTSFTSDGVVPFLFLSISIFAVYPVIFSSIKNMSEVAKKREIERQNKLLLAQIENENLQIVADRQSRHDRRHHNIVMLEFANKNDVESLKAYLKNLVENEPVASGDVRYCKNSTINTVLSVYERRAIDSGISVRVSADAGSDMPVAPQDLVIIIANLFENAINAAEKLNVDDKLIDISIREDAHRLLIKIENTCSSNLTFDETLYGIGISSVISTTLKYDGMYDFAVENERFIAKISLNLQ